MLHSFTGTSGATIIIDRDERKVIKSGTGTPPEVVNRVVEQGRWLHQRSDVAGLPRVLMIDSDAYVMPMYQPVHPLQPPTEMLLTVYNQLEETLWRRHGAWNPFQRGRFRHYLVELVKRELPVIGLSLVNFLDEGHLDQCTPCDAHGDPTLDNVMINDSEQSLVIIDPIPSYAGSPQLRAVDLGKLLQSAFNYEMIKYQDLNRRVDTARFIKEMITHESEVDATAAFFFCTVHFLRLLRYQTNEVTRETFRSIATALCVSL